MSSSAPLQLLREPPAGIVQRGSPTPLRTFLCSDVVRFAELVDRVGDADALRIMDRHDAMVRGCARLHGGEEVELRGDGFLLAFASSQDALACAVDVQRAFELDRTRHPREPLHLRVAVHRGRVIRDGRRYFGRAIVVAFRLAARARGGEIVVSHETLGSASHGWGDRVHSGRTISLKGFREPLPVVSVKWGSATNGRARGGRPEPTQRVLSV